MHRRYADEDSEFRVLAWTSAWERNVGMDLEEKYLMAPYSENIQATL